MKIKVKFIFPLTNSIKIVIALFVLGTISGCEKEITPYVPGHGEESYVNFYNAVEAIAQDESQNLSIDNMIYINDSVKNEYLQPAFSKFTSTVKDGRQFPHTFTSNYLHNIWAGNIFSGNVYWLPLPAQDFYRFIFTSANKSFLKDITLSIAPKSFTTLYLTESPHADNEYAIIAVPVSPVRKVGKVQIQVVNLATDWGNIDAVLTDRKGNEIPTALPSNLGFGKYSDFIEVDPTYADEYNQLVIKFRKHGESRFTLTTAISAIPGRAYSIVTKGFANEALRYIKKSDNQDVSVKIIPSLRVHNRIIY